MLGVDPRISTFSPQNYVAIVENVLKKFIDAGIPPVYLMRTT
jgi:hypothetical protein